MISYFNGDDNRGLKRVDGYVKGCWIHAENPSAGEIDFLVSLTGVERDFLTAALDSEESARLETDENSRLILIDAPLRDTDGKVDTVPLALIVTDECLVSVCGSSLDEVNSVIEKGKIGMQGGLKRLAYGIIYSVINGFLTHLKQIDKNGLKIQQRMGKKTLENKEIMELLELQKSLVFFSASLSSDKSVVEKLILTADVEIKDVKDAKLKKSDLADKEFLEELLIEVRQAAEMCAVYREVLKNVTDAVSSIVNNNMNFIMKFLTAITIILSIPMVIAGFWGMNTAVPWEGRIYGFYIAVGISAAVSILAIVWFIRRKMM